MTATYRAAWIVLAMTSATLGARAQEPSRRQEARALFDDAVRRLRAGHFAEARDLLNQSLVLAPNPAAGFNLGVAYRGAGESIRATEVLEGLLEGRYGQLGDAQRREVTELLRATRAEIGTLSIEARGAPVAQVRVDGRLVGDAHEGQPLEVRVDPGERLVVASATDREASEHRAHVRRGGRARVVLVLRPTMEARVGTLIVEAARPDHEIEIVGVARARGRLERTVEPRRYVIRVRSADGERESAVVVRPRSTVRYQFDDPESEGALASPVFWIAAVGVVAAVTASAVLLVGPPREDPVSDPEFGIVEALRARP